MIQLSEEDLTQLVEGAFEEGFREGVQKGRGFSATGWDESHTKNRLAKLRASAIAPSTPPRRKFLDDT